MTRRLPATHEIVESIRAALREGDYATATAIAETIDEPPSTTDVRTEQASTVGSRFRDVFEQEAEP